MTHIWIYRGGAPAPAKGQLAFLVCRGDAARITSRPWRSCAVQVVRVLQVTRHKVRVAPAEAGEAFAHLEAWRASVATPEGLQAARDAMTALERAIIADGRFPNIAADSDEWGSVILLDHDQEMPELDRCWGIQCVLGDDGRFTVARVYCQGELKEVRDKSDPVDALDLQPLLMAAFYDTARRQVAQRAEDEAEDDRYYEQYEQAVHEHDRHLDGP